MPSLVTISQSPMVYGYELVVMADPVSEGAAMSPPRLALTSHISVHTPLGLGFLPMGAELSAEAIHSCSVGPRRSDAAGAEEEPREASWLAASGLAVSAFADGTQTEPWSSTSS